MRELRNVMERAAVLTEASEIDESLVRALVPAVAGDVTTENEPLVLAVAEAERRTILRALARTNDNKAAAASLLGIGERTLWSKLKKYEI